jgi:hypothetical protein
VAVSGWIILTGIIAAIELPAKPTAKERALAAHGFSAAVAAPPAADVPTGTPPTISTTTAPAPDDLGMVLVDLSPTGYTPADSPYAGLRDLEGYLDDLGGPPEERDTLRAMLVEAGFTRAFVDVWTSPDGTGVSLAVLEFASVDGAAGYLERRRIGVSITPGQVYFEPDGVPKGVGVAYDNASSPDGGVFHARAVDVAKGARIYQVVVASPVADPGPEAVTAIALQQFEAG